MHIEGLDDIDNRILELLTNDARMSYSEIGNKVGLSRVAVKTRIDSLEEKGIIQGYHAVVNPANVPDTIRFFLDIETYPDDFNDVLDEVAMSKMIRKVYHVTGDCRIHAEGLAPNTKELNRYANSLYNCRKGIRKLRCDTVLSIKKDMDEGVDYVRREEHENMEGRAGEQERPGRV